MEKIYTIETEVVIKTKEKVNIRANSFEEAKKALENSPESYLSHYRYGDEHKISMNSIAMVEEKEDERIKGYLNTTWSKLGKLSGSVVYNLTTGMIESIEDSLNYSELLKGDTLSELLKEDTLIEGTLHLDEKHKEYFVVVGVDGDGWMETPIYLMKEFGEDFGGIVTDQHITKEISSGYEIGHEQITVCCQEHSDDGIYIAGGLYCEDSSDCYYYTQSASKVDWMNEIASVYCTAIV